MAHSHVHLLADGAGTVAVFVIVLLIWAVRAAQGLSKVSKRKEDEQRRRLADEIQRDVAALKRRGSLSSRRNWASKARQ
jgi:hypothetical protein